MPLAWLVVWGHSPDALAARVNAQLAANQAPLEFAREADGAYLSRAAARLGGYRKFRFHVLPVPKGWGEGYWGTFSAEHRIQSDHDPVYPLIQTDDGFKLGSEILEETFGTHAQVAKATAFVELSPATRAARLRAQIELKQVPDRAVVFALNQPYEITPQASVQRVGGLLIWSPPADTKVLDLRYQVSLARADEDQIAPTHAYLSAFWLPNVSRLPHDTDITIVGPKDWQLRSEGLPAAEKHPKAPQAGRDQKSVRYQSTFPISFPKVTGGSYELAHEEKDAQGRFFRAWQMAPVDTKRAQADVKRMVETAAWLDGLLGPWPFPGYEVFDGVDYYGIESYSHTILAPSISTRYLAHEMVHTFFGGIVPCAYVQDTWNEGVTTYVDDVLSGRHVDKPLESGLRSVGIPVALADMRVAWEFGNASYTRGAYVMKMLEHEIGRERMLKGLRRLIAERRRKPTVWADLQACFEETPGELGWFWKQWIAGAKFPRLTLGLEDGRVAVSQDLGYRLRFRLVFRGEKEVRRTVTMAEAKATFEIPPGTQEIVIDPMEMTLARVGPPIRP